MEKCKRNGCGGEIVDGICEDCGKPPVGVTTLAPAPAAAPGGDATFATGSGKTTGTVATSRSTSRRQTSRSNRGATSRKEASLGGGIVSLPPLPKLDPLKLVMAKPEVPAVKRICPNPDCVDENGKPTKMKRTKGFCGACGTEYNFEPSAKAGDIICGKYEIKGPIAFGGLGWIYLAYDIVLSRWVVLKGLLNAKDSASAATAVAERQFLAAIKHPKVVGIYDFVKHGSEGFIVMEYVGGTTIENLRKGGDTVTVYNEIGKPIKNSVLRKSLTEDERKLESKLEKRGVLPVEEAISYILGILPAFSYLHNNGFVYCDFKAENLMLEEDDVKLVDVGAMRRIGDPNGDIYGTFGYMAPEASGRDADPVGVSDLYSIGRCLAVLIMDFNYQKEFMNSLPTPDQQPVLAEHDSLYRFLLRATHQDMDQRFQTAEEMATQLFGVLREIVSLKTTPHPAESRVFTGDNLLDPSDITGCKEADIRLLPSIKLDMNDAAGNDIMRVTAIGDSTKRLNAMADVAKKYGSRSVESRLRLADMLIHLKTADSLTQAGKILVDIEKEDEFDWRVQWYLGKLMLAKGDAANARSQFGKVYFEMPGEVAPKLAIAFAAELAGNQAEAIRFYDRVIKVDPTYTTACFGLARCLVAKKDVAGAANALNAIPSSHSLFTRARIILAELLMSDEAALNDQGIDQAAQVIASVSNEGGTVHQLSARLFTCLLKRITEGRANEDHSRRVLGRALNLTELRCGAELEYRHAARFAATAQEKIRWIDLANAVRPQSLV